jgi:ribonucleoside-diphosphate reductase alpha chain
MYGIGNYYQYVSIGNCFVIGNKSDSYGGIMKTDQEQVQIMKRRGGVGHDLSHLRPKGFNVSNAAKTTSGLASFIKRYTNSTAEVAQEGRRGALMLSCDINHPDILDFINCKADGESNESANISVKIDNTFMNNVIKQDDKATSLLKQIAHNAWKYAEPGILFWNTIIDESPADCYDMFQTVSTNPCGELPLCTYDSCRLGHLNLFSYVENPYLNNARFNISKFSQDVHVAQRLMDDMIDLELMRIVEIIDKIDSDPEPYLHRQTEYLLWKTIFSKTYLGRRTGLGITGLGDMLAAMGLHYGTDRANAFIHSILRRFAVMSYCESIELAKTRGSFPYYSYNSEKNHRFIKRILQVAGYEIDKKYKKYGRRNIANLTIAPTGSVSLLTRTTSGIEPVFQLQYTRKKKNKDEGYDEFDVIHPKYKEYLEIEHKDKIKDPYIGCTALDIDVKKKIDMQGIAQDWIDHAISVTHNVKKDFSEDKVFDLILYAWSAGCKGFTMYREGSRSGILVNKEETFEYVDAIKRPKALECNIHFVSVKGKKWIILIGLLSNNPYEVFAFPYIDLGLKEGSGRIIKVRGGIYNLETESVIVENIVGLFGRPEEEYATRLISANLRHKNNPKYLYEQLNKAPGDINDFSRAIARVLKKYIKDSDLKTSEICQCGGNLEYQGGCLVCKSCGFSKCD